MRYSLKSTVTMAIGCFLALSSTAMAAPIAQDEAETELLQIQFALLVSTDPQSLTTESWNITDTSREETIAELELLQSKSPDEYSQPKSPQNLLQKLKPLTQNGQFKVLYAAQWSQPTTQKRSVQHVEASVDNVEPFNLAFGQLKIIERSALISQLDVKLIDTFSLSPPQEDLALKNQINAEINSNTFESTFSGSELEMPSQEQDQSPIVFIKQQRQVKLNKILYFDHPVTPGFLLITSKSAS